MTPSNYPPTSGEARGSAPLGAVLVAGAVVLAVLVRTVLR